MSVFPLNLSIQTVSGCNSSCTFCGYTSQKNILKKEIMTMDLFKRLMDEASLFKPERIIPCLMNEPLLDPMLPERIRYAKDKNPYSRIHFMTNGILLDRELGKKILDTPLDYIGFSVHAIRNATYKNICGRDSLERVKENISAFTAQVTASNKKVPEYLLINITRDKNFLTEEEAEEAIDYWKKLGITRVEYFSNPASMAGNVEVLKIKRREDYSGCNSIWTENMIHILSDGTVVPCCMDWQKQIILGNTTKAAIYDIWNGENYEKFRKMQRGVISRKEIFLCNYCEEAKGVQTFNETVYIAYGAPVNQAGLQNLLGFIKNEKDRGVLEIKDPTLLNDHAVRNKFLELLSANGLQNLYLKLYCSYFINFSKEDFESLAGFGKIRLVMNLGSGSDEVLDKWERGFKVSDADWFLRNCSAAGILVGLEFVVGFPGEKENNFCETLNFVKRNRKEINWIEAIHLFEFDRESVFYKDKKKYEIFFPSDDYLKEWNYKGYNNLSYRIKKANEFGIVLEKLGLKPGLEPERLEEYSSFDLQNLVFERYRY